MPDEKRSDFSDATEEARETVRDKQKTSRLAEEAEDKAERHQSVLSPIKEDLDVLIRMVRSWALGDYRKIPWKTIILIVGAVIYFLNPIDLIPDFIYGLGFVDDIAIIKFVVGSIREDLDQFLAWEDAL